jgi:hypothetical protein
MATREGTIGPAGYSMGECLQKMSGWYDWKELDISGETGNVTVATKYPQLSLTGILNNNADAATVIVRTVVTPGTSITLTIPANTPMYPIPPIATIIQSGTSDNLILMFQKR